MTLDEVQAEIEHLRVAEVAPGLAAVAVSLAQALQEAEAPTSKAVVARELRATLLELRKVAPVESEGDALDELTRKREARRARGA
jgi:hypothetical protein